MLTTHFLRLNSLAKQGDIRLEQRVTHTHTHTHTKKMYKVKYQKVSNQPYKSNDTNPSPPTSIWSNGVYTGEWRK